MEYRTLGRSDLQVSAVGIGCNNLGGRIDMDRSRQVIWKALDVGVNFFDTAPTYGRDHGSEKALGEFLGKRREDIVLATKFGTKAPPEGGSAIVTGSDRKTIMAEVDASLKRLKTDYIDLYQQHRPDPNTPIEETLDALQELIQAGKIRYAGTGSTDGAHIEEWTRAARDRGQIGYVSCQEEYSLLNRDVEKELIPALVKTGVSLLPFFPLASGLLTGKYRQGQPMPADARLTKNDRMANRFMTAESLAKTEELIRTAERFGTTMLSVAISWLLTRNPVASVIAGATSADQVVANVKASEFIFTPADLARIDAITA